MHIWLYGPLTLCYGQLSRHAICVCIIYFKDSLPGMTPSLASHCWRLFNFAHDERSKRSWSEHPPYEQEQNTLQWRTFTVTLSTLQEKGDFNRGRGRIETPAFSTRTEH